MLLPLFDALQVQHDLDLSLLRFQWIDPLNHRLRPALEYGRDLVVEYQPRRALVDFRGLPQLSIQDQLWMSGHWLPRIAAQPLQQAAPVYDVSHMHVHNQMAAEAMLWVGRHLIRFQLQLFDSESAGLY